MFYSAFTQLIGYKPVSEEYLLQRDSEKGDPKRYLDAVRDYFTGTLSLKYNLHCGILDWPYSIDSDQDRRDIAAAVQQVFEEQADMVMLKARQLSASRNLVYMGGCAMNSRYNQHLNTQWDHVWSLPNTGDPSSAIGAALLSLNTRITLPRACY
jgi:predicted NodU family carbamoyl transferase